MSTAKGRGEGSGVRGQDGDPIRRLTPDPSPLTPALNRCHACGGSDLEVILSLGMMPLANSLLTEEQLQQPEARYPLDLAFCPGCSLVQITESVPPELLFREYLYFTSFSDMMLRHAEQMAADLIRQRKLDSHSLVVEIASNDGYLLQHFVKAGIPVLGIEPARNIAVVADARGIRTLPEFFGFDLATSLAAAGERADVIVANNVMAHVPDINGVLAGIRTLLKPEGVFIMETPYVRDLVDHLEFDTIYHEHLFYYSLTALETLFRRHGLAAAAVERLPIHGGSLRVTAAHGDGVGCGVKGVGRASGARHPSPFTPHPTPADTVRALLAEEAEAGLAAPHYYRGFAERVALLRRELRALLERLKAEGRCVAAYGAAAKGSTLLNSMGIGGDLLDFVVDRSSYKQGRYMSGVHLPIHAPAMLLEQLPDYVLLLTWNFADEIMRQQAEYRRRGGRFVIPIPEPRVV